MFEEVNLKAMTKNTNKNAIVDSIYLFASFVKYYIFVNETSLPETLLSMRVKKEENNDMQSLLYQDLMIIHPECNKF